MENQELQVTVTFSGGRLGISGRRLMMQADATGALVPVAFDMEPAAAMTLLADAVKAVLVSSAQERQASAGLVIGRA